MNVDTLTLDEAALVARLHRELNPDHDLNILHCHHQQPCGIVCYSCVELLCAIEHEDTP